MFRSKINLYVANHYLQRASRNDGACLTYLIERVMFPTIFSMALTDISGSNTKTASSYCVMSIMGGAIIPILRGLLGETDMAFGFLVPLELLCGHNALCILLQATYILNK